MNLDDFLPTRWTKAVCTLTLASVPGVMTSHIWLTQIGAPAPALDPFQVRLTMALAAIALGAVVLVVLLLVYVAELKRQVLESTSPRPAALKPPTSFWESKSETAPVVLESKQERILIVLTEKGHRVDQLAKKTGAEAELVKYHLHKLQDLDMVAHSSGVEGTFWSLQQPGREYLVSKGLL